MSLLKEEEWYRNKMRKIPVDLCIIGIVHSQYKNSQDIPLICKDEISEIEIYKNYSEGLKDISGFSHLHVFFWLHKSEGHSLIVKTPWDKTLHGLFTTCSPHRPNPLGHTIIELIEKKGRILTVKGLDAIDGTPIIDIKPYVKKSDIKLQAVSGWIEKIKLKGN